MLIPLFDHFRYEDFSITLNTYFSEFYIAKFFSENNCFKLTVELFGLNLAVLLECPIHHRGNVHTRYIVTII